MTERRTQQRHNITSLEYITFGGSNGGIIVDASVSGLGVQTVAALEPSTAVNFSVLVPQPGEPIEGSAHVIWVTPTGQAGLQFARVSEVARARIAEWLLTITTVQKDGSGTDSPQQTTTTPFGWTAPMQPQRQAQEGTPAPISFEEWAQIMPGLRDVPVISESNGNSMTTSSTSATADPVGPFPLLRKAIEACVTQRGWAIYMVGRFESARFQVMRLDRSCDLANDLYSYVGDYQVFKFAYYPSEKQAFQKQCELYHRLRPVNNKSHPRKPAATDWDCPVCHGFS